MLYFTVQVGYAVALVEDGVAPKSTLAYTAPNVCYYVKNNTHESLTEIQKDVVANCVVNHALGMKIPAIAVRKFVAPRRKKPTSDLKTLFD